MQVMLSSGILYPSPDHFLPPLSAPAWALLSVCFTAWPSQPGPVAAKLAPAHRPALAGLRISHTLPTNTRQAHPQPPRVHNKPPSTTTPFRPSSAWLQPSRTPQGTHQTHVSGRGLRLQAPADLACRGHRRPGGAVPSGATRGWKCHKRMCSATAGMPHLGSLPVLQAGQVCAAGASFTPP